MNGDRYNGSVVRPTSCICCNDGQFDTVEYNLGRDYATFDSVVGVTDESRAGFSVKMSVIGDGNVLGYQEVAVGVSQPLHVDVTNVLRLQLRYDWLFADLCHLADDPLITPVFANAVLSSSSAAGGVQAAVGPSGTALATIDPAEGFVKVQDVNMNGDRYNGSVVRPTSCICCNDGQFDTVEYNLGRDYATFDSVVGVTDESRAGFSVKMSVIGDGNVLGYQEVAVGVSQPLHVDLTNVLRLQLRYDWLFPDLCHLADDPLITPVFANAVLN